MWTRRELKKAAKVSFKANYWKCILIALLFAVVTGGAARTTYKANDAQSTESTTVQSDIEEKIKKLIPEIEKDGYVINGSASQSTVYKTAKSQLFSNASRLLPNGISNILVVGVLGFSGLFFTVLNIFVFNVLNIGCCGFFVANAAAPSNFNPVGAGFNGSAYTTNVLTMFLRDLFTALWSLLFVIPGIIKAYEYCMIPYILADNPGISRKEAFKLSKEMMAGNKWRTFILDLSFIGWAFLNAITFGIVGVFWLSPYRCQTKANLYLALR